MPRLFRCVLLALPMAALLTGCAMTSTGTAAVSPSSVTIQGHLYGGQQAVVGGHIYLFSPSPGGYGSSSISMLKSSVLTNNPSNSGVDSSSDYYVTTNSSGYFTISSDYSCTAGNEPGGTPVTFDGRQPVYLYAVSGNPGFGTNSAAGFLAALGRCDSLTSSTSVQINEVTTVAMAYAVSGFATDATHISRSTSALAAIDLDNAFANAGNLVDLPSGNPLSTTPGGNGTVPQAEIYTLANILAACVNSTGSGSTQCSSLLGAATSTGASGGTVPTDTATAAINIAHHPGLNVDTLYKVPTGTTAFGGGLTAEPNDFSIGINYTGGGLNQPNSIAIDASGNAWTANYGNSSITELSNLGAAVSSSSGFTGGGINGPAFIAIDPSGDPWVTNVGNKTVSEFSHSGSPISTSSGFACATSPSASQYGIAIDASGNVWVADNFLSVLYELSSSGSVLSPASGYGSGYLNTPNGIAIDAAGDVWVSNLGGSAAKFSSQGAAISPKSGYYGGGINNPFAIAIDASGDAWLANAGNGTLTEFSNSGMATSSTSGYTGGGLNYGPVALSIDGAGNVWSANYGSSTAGSTISEFSNLGAPISPNGTGFYSSSLNLPYAIAADGSGDVWVANSGNNTVTEFIGLSTPVVTPVVANLISPYTHPASQP